MSAVDSIQQTVTGAKEKIMGVDSALSGEEPPSGIQGKGTVDEPYDQGNAPENIGLQSGQEPVSGAQGKGTATEPYDQGNSGESTTSSQPTNSTASNNSTTAKASSDKPTDARTKPLSAPMKTHSEERDVSPGTLSDGSHARTSGDRGESYEPAKGFNRLKGKLGLGRH